VCRRQENQPTNQQSEGVDECGKLRNMNQTHIAADAARARTLEKLKLKPFQLREKDG